MKSQQKNYFTKNKVIGFVFFLDKIRFLEYTTRIKYFLLKGGKLKWTHPGEVLTAIMQNIVALLFTFAGPFWKVLFMTTVVSK